MSRRTAGLSALAATLVVGGFVPALLGGASAAAGCPSWTDPKGDSNTGQLGNQTGQQGDANLDIVGASLTISADSIVAAIKSDKLNATASDQGDEFHVLFTVGGKDLMIYSDRAGSELGAGPKMPVGDDVGFYSVTDKKKASGKATSVYDLKTSTLTITGKLSELATLAGVPIAGKPVTKISAESQNYFYGADRGLLYDQAPTTLTATLNADCADGGGPGPTPTATPSPTPSPTPTGGPAPAGLPAAGCSTVADPKGDAVNVIAGGQPGNQDPDLDILGLTFLATDDDFKTFLKLDKLTTKAANTAGHSFYAYFTVGGKDVTLIATQYDPAQLGQVQDQLATGTAGTAAAREPLVRIRVAGTYVASTIKATWDVANSYVIFSIKPAEFQKATGLALTAGESFTKVLGRDASSYGPGVGGFFVDSTAPANAAAGTATWVIGDNACFGPPPAVLANTGAVSSQYGDPAKVAAKLTSSTGSALAGKSVTFGLAGKAVIATTNAAGVASASIPLSVTAGPQTLSIAFAGDATADKVSMTTPFTVVQEKTKLILAITKKGTSRTVVATLLDDDNKPVAGQKLVFAVNGKTIATLTTGSTGKATFTKANPGQTVKVTFAAVTGKWLGTTAQAKV